MRSDTAQRGGHRLQTHRLGGAIGVLAAVALALTATTPASASPSTERPKRPRRVPRSAPANPTWSPSPTPGTREFAYC